MLGKTDALATIAVRNIEVARAFYEDKLGLTPLAEDEPGVAAYRSGRSTVLVYESEFAGTNKSTAATWTVSGDVQDAVDALREKGLSFEHYDLPDTTREGDVHVSGHVRVAWLKDPDGNVLSLVEDTRGKRGRASSRAEAAPRRGARARSSGSSKTRRRARA